MFSFDSLAALNIEFRLRILHLKNVTYFHFLSGFYLLMPIMSLKSGFQIVAAFQLNSWCSVCLYVLLVAGFVSQAAGWLGLIGGGDGAQQHQVMNYYLDVCLPHHFSGLPTTPLQPPVPVQQIWCFLKTPKLLSYGNNFFNICWRERRNILEKRRGFAQEVAERKQLFVLPFLLPRSKILFWKARASKTSGKQAGIYSPSSLLFYAKRCREKESKIPDFRVRRKLWKFIESSLNANFIHYSARFF